MRSNPGIISLKINKGITLMKPTVKSIAQKLGVSPSAVSFAINGKSGISEETRQRILAELEKCGYKKKKSVPSIKRHIRYVVFHNNEHVVQETNFSSLVLKGIEDVASEYGCEVVITYFDASKDWNSQLEIMIRDTAGFIVLATDIRDEHILKALSCPAIKSLHQPVVLVDNATTLVDADCVVTGNLDGAYKAVSYLFSLGHPDVGYLRSVERIDNFDERQAGYEKARHAANLPDDKVPCIINVGISSEQAFADMNKWLDDGNVPPSALFAENDFIALSAMRALKAHGYSIPEDISIIGFDDMPFSSMSEPPLTTVCINKDQIGHLAVNFLLEKITQNEMYAPKYDFSPVRATVSAKLVLRETTAAFNKK